MPCTYNSIMFLKVNRISDEELVAECTLLSDRQEAVGWLSVEVTSLKIKRAGWALYRNPDGITGYYELPELAGIEAFLNAGPDLKQVLAGPDQVLARELLSECVRGVIQAETFFFTERGYASAADYDAFWDKINAKGCKYYSHLDQVEKAWMDFAGNLDRSYSLFNRAKKVSVRQHNHGFMINGTFIDSFHELGVLIQIDQGGIIKEIQGEYTSAPDKICWDNTAHLHKFIGREFAVMTKKEVASLAGGPEGCNHLVDILYEAVGAARTLFNMDQ